MPSRHANVVPSPRRVPPRPRLAAPSVLCVARRARAYAAPVLIPPHEISEIPYLAYLEHLGHLVYLTYLAHLGNSEHLA